MDDEEQTWQALIANGVTDILHQSGHSARGHNKLCELRCVLTHFTDHGGRIASHHGIRVPQQQIDFRKHIGRHYHLQPQILPHM